jgi:hypothetical protein
MSPELDTKLCEKYPLIFRDRHADMSTTSMCWGLTCDDGWYNLIDKACATIQGYIHSVEATIERNIKFNGELEEHRGFNFENWPSFYSREPRVIPEPVEQFVATQVKEKFGGLRFYHTGGNAFTSGVVTLAEELSYVTCEVCGNPAKTSQKNGWVKTLCNVHERL